MLTQANTHVVRYVPTAYIVYHVHIVTTGSYNVFENNNNCAGDQKCVESVTKID